MDVTNMMQNFVSWKWAFFLVNHNHQLIVKKSGKHEREGKYENTHVKRKQTADEMWEPCKRMPEHNHVQSTRYTSSNLRATPLTPDFRESVQSNSR